MVVGGASTTARALPTCVNDTDMSRRAAAP